MSRASLGIYSDTHLASEVSGVLGLMPSKIHEKGDSRTSKTGRSYAPYKSSAWVLDADPALNDPDDEYGFASLRVLLDAIGDRGAALAALRPHYRTVIWWTGETGSSQGNFSIAPDLVVGLGRLGCWFYGNMVPADDDGDVFELVTVGPR